MDERKRKKFKRELAAWDKFPSSTIFTSAITPEQQLNQTNFNQKVIRNQKNNQENAIVVRERLQ